MHDSIMFLLIWVDFQIHSSNFNHIELDLGREIFRFCICSEEDDWLYGIVYW